MSELLEVTLSNDEEGGALKMLACGGVHGRAKREAGEWRMVSDGSSGIGTHDAHWRCW